MKSYTEEEIKELLKGEKRYYVYILKDSDEFPFYVGKGRGLRLLGHKQEVITKNSLNLLKYEFIKSIIDDGRDLLYSIHNFYGNQKIAYEEEKILIGKYGRIINNTGILTNIKKGETGSLLEGSFKIDNKKDKDAKNIFKNNNFVSKRLNFKRFSLKIYETLSSLSSDNVYYFNRNRLLFNNIK